MGTVLTAKEASTYLHCSYWLITKMVRENKLPYFKIGRKILFNEEALNDWIKENTTLTFY